MGENMQIFKATILNKSGNTYISFDDFSNIIPYPAYKIPECFRNDKTLVYLKIPSIWIKYSWEFTLRE